MPTYNYKCQTCSLTMSIIRRMKEEEMMPVCVNCAKNMVRDYKAPPITFKGSGWAGKEK